MKKSPTKKILHDALILTAFTLVLGFVLGGVHEITKERIKAAEIATEEAAYRAVFAEAAAFQELEQAMEEINLFLEEMGYKDTIKSIQAAMDDSGNVLGYVVNVIANDGSQSNIAFSVGITNEGVVNGYSITDISETPGLGSKAEEEEFAEQFRGKDVDEMEDFEVVKSDADSSEDIEAITGATITSRAMANGVNAAVDVFEEFLRDAS